MNYRILQFSFIILATTSLAYGENRSTDEKNPSTLTTSGTAEIEVPADEAKISLSVVTENKDSAEALEINNALVEKVIESLQDVGLKKHEYQSGNFQIVPQYSDYKFGSADHISGYTVTNSINITTVRIELLGKIISDSNKAGANHINSINFGLADPRTKRDFVIRQATEYAMEDAKFLASAAKVDLLRILSIDLDNGSNNIVFPRTAFRAQESSHSLKNASLPPIEPGNTTIRSTVTVTHEIRPSTN